LVCFEKCHNSNMDIKKDNTNQNNFSESILKGRMAETLVEELLKKSGNTVYRFGYEAIMQNLTQIKKSFDIHSEMGEKIRTIPDFVVVDGNGALTLLEVKFRWNGQLHIEDKERLKRIRSFWNPRMIFVNCYTKPFFRISDGKYIDEKGELISKPLMEEAQWNISPTNYIEFEALVEKYLKPTLWPESSKQEGLAG